MLMKWLNISGIWLMAIPEFGVILYAVSHINAFPSRNSGSCRVG
jgi:Na+/glutamate symporter